MLRLASMVAEGKMEEEQALGILANWTEYEPTWESLMEIALKEALKRLKDRPGK